MLAQRSLHHCEPVHRRHHNRTFRDGRHRLTRRAGCAVIRADIRRTAWLSLALFPSRPQPGGQFLLARLTENSAQLHDALGASRTSSAAMFSVGAAMPLLMVVTSTAGVPCPHGVRGVFGFSRSSGCDRGKSRRANILRCHSPSNFLGRVGDGSHRRYRKSFWYGCLKIRSAYQAMAHLRNNQLSSAFRFSGTGTMFRQTCIKPEMSSSRAAIWDKSTILPLTKGPRSVIRTTTVRPFS